MIFSSTLSFGQETPLAQYKAKISQIYSNLPEEEKGEPTRFTEWTTGENYNEASKLAPTVWREVLANIEQIAPTEGQRTIIFQSFETLAPADYLTFQEQALELYKRKVINGREFENVFYSPGRMQFFLPFNYNEPRVQAFLKDAQKTVKLDSLFSTIGETLSGKMRELCIGLRRNHPDLANKPIPLLAGGYLTKTAPEAHPTAKPFNAPLNPGWKVTPTPQPTIPKVEANHSSGFPLLLVVILAALIASVAVFFLLRRKSP